MTPISRFGAFRFAWLLTQGSHVLETLGQLLPFAIAGAFVPTWTSRVVIFLGTDRPLGTSIGYVVGNFIYRIVLGAVALFVASVAAPRTSTQGISMPVWFAFSAAGILIALGFYLISRKPKTETGVNQELPGWLRAFKRLPVWATTALGLFNCAAPGVQYVYFLGGIGVIASSGLTAAEQFVVLVVFALLLQTMMVVPIVIYIWQRERAQAVFDRLDLWLATHGSTVMGVILAGIGALFVVIGLSGGQVGGA